MVSSEANSSHFGTLEPYIHMLKLFSTLVVAVADLPPSVANEAIISYVSQSRRTIEVPDQNFKSRNPYKT